MMETDAEDFGERLTYLVRRVNGALSSELDAHLRSHRLTQAQLSALAQLDVSAPVPLTGAQLAHRAGITAQSMSAAVAGLLVRELVSSAPRANHGRKIDLTITDEGLRVLKEVQRSTREAEQRFDLGLDPTEVAQLRDYLRRIMRAQGLFLPSEQKPGQ